MACAPRFEGKPPSSGCNATTRMQQSALRKALLHLVSSYPSMPAGCNYRKCGGARKSPVVQDLTASGVIFEVVERAVTVASTAVVVSAPVPYIHAWGGVANATLLFFSFPA